MDDDFTLSLLMKRNSDKTAKEKKITKQLDTSLDWQREKQVYEVQLNQLQEQLVASMVQNQHLEAELVKFQKDVEATEELRKTIERKEAKIKQTEELLEQALQEQLKLSSSPSGMVDDVGSDPLEEDTQASEQPQQRVRKRDRFKVKILNAKIASWNFLHERLTDFIKDEDYVLPEEEDDELSVRRLKENVGRFSDAIQPIKNFYTSMFNVFSWNNPWLTIMVFAIYMYALWLEVLIPLAFLLSVIQLSFNYLHARGIAYMFTKAKRRSSIEETTNEDQSSSSLSERYQLVLQIARKVQNTLGSLSDNFEKLHNLFLWESVEATKALYTYLLVGFVASCLLTTNTFLTLSGVAVGVKLFFITPIYKRFPKVQKRYDEFDRMWRALPTRNKQVEEDRSNQSSPELSSSPTPPTATVTSSPSTESTSSWENIVFCDRFQLPANEAPLHEWIEGRRCTLMDKDSPLSSMKHGRLYLTPNFLCFERNQFHTKKNVAIKLTEIVTIKKAKPISFMPGPGMAIEIEVIDVQKPYLFAAMMGRDEAFDSVVRAGKILNLNWAL